jgi:HSP20 family protein
MSLLEPFRGDSFFPAHPHFPFFSNLFPRHREGSDISIYEHKNNIIVEAAVPGIDPKDVHVSYERGVLTIQAEKKEEKTDKEKRYFHKSSSSFVYHLPSRGISMKKHRQKQRLRTE